MKFTQDETKYYCDRHEQEWAQRRKRMNRSFFQRVVDFFKEL